MCECTTEENVLKNVIDRDVKHICSVTNAPTCTRMYMSLIRAWCVCPQKKMANGLSVILDRDTITEWRIRIQIAVVDEDRSSYQLSWSWMLLGTWCPSLPFDDNLYWDILMTSMSQVLAWWCYSFSMTMISDSFWYKSCLLVATFEARGKHQCFFYVCLWMK